MIFSIIFCLFFSTHDILLLGEKDKWVPMSPKRIQQIAFDQTGVGIDFTGAVNEKVSFIVARISAGSSIEYETFIVDLGSTGTSHFIIR